MLYLEKQTEELEKNTKYGWYIGFCLQPIDNTISNLEIQRFGFTDEKTVKNWQEETANNILIKALGVKVWYEKLSADKYGEYITLDESKIMCNHIDDLLKCIGSKTALSNEDRGCLLEMKRFFEKKRMDLKVKLIPLYNNYYFYHETTENF